MNDSSQSEEIRVCLMCPNTIRLVPKNAMKIYCGDRCREAAYRKKKKEKLNESKGRVPQ